MNKERLNSVIKEYNESEIQSEQEVRSKLIVPLLELLEYPSKLRAEEFPIYGFEGSKRLPVKFADFLLFSDSNFGLHKKLNQENLDWVQNHSLLIVEAKKPEKSVSILGQPVYYTIWSKAVAYLIIDGEYIKGYYYDSIASDKKLIDCKINDLMEHDEIWGFSYQNILSLKNLGKSKILMKSENDCDEPYIFDKELDKIYESIQNNIPSKSSLIEDFQKIEAENFMRNIKDNMDLLECCSKNVQDNYENQFDLIPYKYKNGDDQGKNFSIPNINGMVTIGYEIYKAIDYESFSRYYIAEPIEYIDNYYEERRVEFRTFFIEDPQPDGNQIILLHFLKNKLCINIGILLGESVLIHGNPSVMMKKHYPSESFLRNLNYYDLEKLSDEELEEFLNTQNTNSDGIWYETDIRMAPPVIIDCDTIEQIKREVYYDNEKKCLKARVKIKPNNQYFVFQLTAKNKKFIPLTPLEKGKFYKNGQYGFPKNMHEAFLNFEKDNSGESFFEIAYIFKDEPDMKSNQMFYKYLCKSADLKYVNAIIELTLCVYYNETSIKKFKDCVFLLLDVKNDNCPARNFVLAYFIEIGLVKEKTIKDAFDLYFKASLQNYKPAQVRLMCSSKKEVENSERNKLLNNFMDSILEQKNLCFYCMGCICFFGIGIKNRKKEGIDLLLKSAYCGNINAQFTVFEIYDSDTEYKDEIEATNWLKKIAKSKTSVYLELSNRLIDGIGCEINRENDRLALFLLKRAALANDKIAINNLGWMYMVGRGCMPNYEYARELLKKSAYLGCATSYFHLGKIYEKGLGVIVDIDRAKEYYHQAYKMGNKKAKLRLHNL